MSEQFIKSQMRGVVGGKNNNNKTAIMVFPGPIWGLQAAGRTKKLETRESLGSDFIHHLGNLGLSNPE